MGRYTGLDKRDTTTTVTPSGLEGLWAIDTGSGDWGIVWLNWLLVDNPAGTDSWVRTLLEGLVIRGNGLLEGFGHVLSKGI